MVSRAMPALALMALVLLTASMLACEEVLPTPTTGPTETPTTGHALGLTGGTDATGAVGAHPQMKDSVMSYSRRKSVSCSPHPFDIMAVYALYQVDD